MLPQHLPIHLSPWIIADGNYDDFSVGDVRAFALEFYAAKPLTLVNSGRRTAQHLGNGEFEVVARSVYPAHDWWVLDFGLPAYTNMPPTTEHKAGKLFQGNISLGVDPFFYFENLALRPSSPPLIFDWRIERIEMQTAPLIERDGIWVRDDENLRSQEVRRTGERRSAGGYVEYLLHCALVGDQPRRTLRAGA